MKCFHSNENENYCKLTIRNSHDIKKYLLKTDTMERDLFSIKYDSSILYNTIKPNYTGYNKSKQYEIKKRRLNLKYSHTVRPIVKRSILNKLHFSSNTILLLTFILFCCWNSVVLTFHLNEESNSVYPKVKSIPSSSFSHRRHSKTVDVFYQSGVSIFSILFFMLLLLKIHFMSYSCVLIGEKYGFYVDCFEWNNILIKHNEIKIHIEPS